MKDLVVKLAETEEERRAAFALRLQVFVREQGVPPEEELDAEDERATHALALVGGRPVGTGRLVYAPLAGSLAGLPEREEDTPVSSFGEGKKVARIGRMAVERACRRRGIGARILRTLEEEAFRVGMAEAVLHAQTYVKAFYAAHGYGEEGEVFLEAGIEHVQMRKRLL